MHEMEALIQTVKKMLLLKYFSAHADMKSKKPTVKNINQNIFILDEIRQSAYLTFDLPFICKVSQPYH